MATHTVLIDHTAPSVSHISVAVATITGLHSAKSNTIPRHTIFPPFCRLRTLAQARPHDDDHLSSIHTYVVDRLRNGSAVGNRFKRLHLAPRCCELERELTRDGCDCALPVFSLPVRCGRFREFTTRHFVSRNAPNEALQGFAGARSLMLPLHITATASFDLNTFTYHH